MPGGIDLPAIFIANLMGIMLCVMTLVGRQWRYTGKDREKHLIRVMLMTVMISCIVDPIVFIADGHPGTLARLTVYIGNTWLFLTNIVMGPAWFLLVLFHVEGKVTYARKIVTILLTGIGILALLINPFVPLVFSVDESSVYTRGPWFWIYMAIDLLFLVDGTVAYILAKRKGGVLQFFPVLQFMVPAIIGFAVQAVFYGVSCIWPCFAISINGLMYGLQSESIYRDGLTGLYNRHYLENIEKMLIKKRANVIAAIMIDLNDFKSINDRYGHRVGDQALIECAGILKQTVGSKGNVIRYAGDEFIVLLNLQQIDNVSAVAERIRWNMSDRKPDAAAPYTLSAAIGYCLFDASKQTVDQLMNTVDAMMYEDKEIYYAAHPEQARRASR